MFLLLTLRKFLFTRKFSLNTIIAITKSEGHLSERMPHKSTCWTFWYSISTQEPPYYFSKETITNKRRRLYCIKSIHIQNFSGPYFLAFGPNTDTYPVNLRIQSECGKIRTRKTLNTDTFDAVSFWKYSCFKFMEGYEFHKRRLLRTQPTTPFSKLTIETLEQGVEYN